MDDILPTDPLKWQRYGWFNTLNEPPYMLWCSYLLCCRHMGNKALRMLLMIAETSHLRLCVP